MFRNAHRVVNGANDDNEAYHRCPLFGPTTVVGHHRSKWVQRIGEQMTGLALNVGKVPDIGVREFQPRDIEPVLDYWLSPPNLAYHMIRGTDPRQWIDPVRETKAFQLVMTTPIEDRAHSAAILTVDGFAVGHVLLNDVKDPTRQRMHFHMWRGVIKRTSLGDTLLKTKYLIRASLEHFFQTHVVTEIVGDVAVANRPANYVLSSMGVLPSETVFESYLGETQPYLRYVFQQDRLGGPNAAATS